MPKRRRHQPGKYKPKEGVVTGPNFTGPLPLTLFQGSDDLWGAKDGAGNVEIEPVYRRLEQTEAQKERNEVLLAGREEILSVTPDDWDLVSWVSTDFVTGDM